MHVSKDAPVVCDDALERLLELQLTVLLVQLHEDLLQANGPCQHLDRNPLARANREPSTYVVEAVQPLLHLQPVRTLRTLVRRVHMLQDQHLHKSVELSL